MMLQHALRAASAKTSTGGIVFYSLQGAAVNTQTSYSIRVPDGVTSIAGLAIGAGGGSGGCSSGASAAAGGGGGGALSYSNSIAVTPGETLTVVVPNQAANGGTGGTAGSAGLGAAIQRSGTNLLLAVGGSGSLGRTGSTAGAGAAGGAAASGVGTVRQSGGTGGAGNAATDNGGGGGGAAGYGATGATGGAVNGSGATGTGGAGGGGASYTGTVQGGSGGGTLWYGAGAGGAGGTGNNASQLVRNGKLGSSLGGSETLFASPEVGRNTENMNGLPGGGGAGAPSGGSVAYSGMRGAGGAVRILWGNGIDWGTATNTSQNTLYVRSYANSSTSSVTMPTVELGDTAFFIDYSQNPSSVPTAVTPTGFTAGLTSGVNNRRFSIYYKQILSSADTGTVLTGANGSTYNSKFIIVISGRTGSSINPYGIQGTSTFGGLGVNTSYSNTVNPSNLDAYAFGMLSSFLFFNSTATVNPDTDMTLSCSTLSTTLVTVPGADSFSYVKVLLYPQVMTAGNSTSIATANLGTNSYYYWYSRFW